MMPSPSRAGAALRPGGPSSVSAADFLPDDRYLDGLEEPFGGRALLVRPGPLSIRLSGFSADQADALATRFSPFVAPADARATSPDLIIEMRRSGRDHFLAPAGEPEIYRLAHRLSGPRLTLWSYEFAGWVDAEQRRGRLALVASAGPLFERGLENFLRVMTAVFALQRGGLLVHGAGVVRDGRAHVFYGPSGSGKTTVTRLCGNDRVLSDDLTLVVPRGNGYHACGIPFGMVHHRRPDTGASFPVASLNRLVQSDEVRREPMSGAWAVADLGGSLPFVMQMTGQAGMALETAARVVAKVPTFRLHFRRDDSFWGVVDRPAGQGHEFR